MEKVYIQLNYGGYQWRELTIPKEFEKRVRMPLHEFKNDLCHSLMQSSRPSFWLIKENGEYALGINNVPVDNSTDTYERPTMEYVVFVDRDKDYLLRILSSWLTMPVEFAEWLTEKCFMNGPECPLCNLTDLKDGLEEFSNVGILKDVNKESSSSQHNILLFGYEGSAKTIEKDFGVSVNEDVMLKESDFILRSDNYAIVKSIMPITSIETPLKQDKGGSGSKDIGETIGSLKSRITKLESDLETEKKKVSQLENEKKDFLVRLQRIKSGEDSNKILMIKRLKACCVGLSLLLIISIIYYLNK